jgi:ABC-type branched-subunit amino acid transport system substrate-binding protein
MRMRNFIALLAVLAMVVVACGDDDATTTTGQVTTTTSGTADTTTTTAASTEPIKIGAVLGISGRFAFVGGPQQLALQMAQEEINAAGGIAGRPVEFVIYDDEVDETKTVPLVNRLIGEDGVVAIIGPSITIPALAIAPIVEEQGIV